MKNLRMLNIILTYIKIYYSCLFLNIKIEYHIKCWYLKLLLFDSILFEEIYLKSSKKNKKNHEYNINKKLNLKIQNIKY